MTHYSTSDPYIRFPAGRKQETHPCVRCGRVRVSKYAWSACEDCRATDRAFCGPGAKTIADRERAS